MKKLKVIGLSLLLAGIIFVMDSQKGIAGFVVAESYGAGIGTLIGMALVIGGVVCMMTRRSLEKEVQEERREKISARHYDPMVKSIRRYMEKGGNKKISYDEAEKEYFRLLKGREDYKKNIMEKEIEKLRESPVENRKEKLSKSDKTLNDLKDVRDSGAIKTYRELQQYAGRLGLSKEEGANHITYKSPEGKVITQIPRHSFATGTYRDILNKLIDYADSKSS